MKSLLVALVLLMTAHMAQARSFHVDCENKEGRSLEIRAQVTGLTTMEISEFKVDGRSEAFRDNSFAPAFNNGDIDLSFVFGRSWDGEAKISLSRCEDTFDNSGSAKVRLSPPSYVGSEHKLKCSCDLDSSTGF